MSSYAVQDITVIMETIDRRLRDHETEVSAVLRRIATGAWQIRETISPKEAEQARAIFGWIAQKGPAQVWAMAKPILRDPALLQGGMRSFDANAALSGDETGFAAILAGVLSVDKRTQARLAVLLLSYLFHDTFRTPQSERGVYDIAANPFQKLKWLYRYWFNQLETAEEGAGLESYFSARRIELQAPRLDSPAAERRTMTVSCAGDLLAVDVLTPKNTPHLFDDITDFYSSADIVSANLESTIDKSSPLGRSQSPGQPARMNTSQAMFQKFRDEAKITYFSTATNHAMDWGPKGVRATLDVLDASGAYHSGTASSQAEQDDVLVVDKHGIKVALLAYTFDLNGYKLPADKPYLVNEVRFNDANPLPDYALIRKQVAAAKAKEAEHIIAYCHWGWEFEMYPHTAIMKAAREVIACGVDTILGNHPHVSQPAEFIERPDAPPALVIYALGDFVSYHPESRNSKLAYIVKFEIVKHGQEKAYVSNLQALPIYILNAKRADGTFDCRILKFENVLREPERYGLSALEKSQLPHLRDKVWNDILAPLSNLGVYEWLLSSG
jgi:poly-gamma-glutamate synthesis protein (capsule biosynthesis protein)